MNNILTSLKRNWVIVAILLLAFFVRIWGIDYGLPHFLIGDEKSIVYGSLKMLELKTLVPAFYPQDFRPMYYPPVIAYIYLIFLSPVLLIEFLFGQFSNLSDFKNFLILDPTVIWLTVRTATALLGTATIYLIYLIGKKLFNKQVGLLSALFLSLSFLHIQLSHFARHWVPATFFVTLVVLFSILIYQKRDNRYYIWAGIFLGLAFGASYITGVGLIIFLFAHFLSGPGNFLKKIKDKNLWIAVSIFLILAVVFVVLHPQEFTRILFGEDSGTRDPKTLVGLLSAFVFHLKNLWYFETTALVFAVLGIIILFFKSKKTLTLLLSLPVFYILSLYFLFHSEVRYTVFILPLLCLLAGFGLNFVFNIVLAKKIGKSLFVIIFVFTFLYPLSVAFKYDYLLTRKDSRVMAKEWIENNIPTEERIITDFSDFKLWPTKEAIVLQQNIAPDSLRQEERVLLVLADDKYPKPAFNVLPFHYLTEKLPANILNYIKENQYRYFAMDYLAQNKISAIDKQVAANSKLIESFSSNFNFDIHGDFQDYIFKIFGLKNFGPTVEIYKINNL